MKFAKSRAREAAMASFVCYIHIPGQAEPKLLLFDCTLKELQTALAAVMDLHPDFEAIELYDENDRRLIQMVSDQFRSH